jgi:hypothetical protein
MVAAHLFAPVLAAFALGGHGCTPGGPVVQPFLPWQDARSYVLAGGGSFEEGTPSWALRDGASVVADAWSGSQGLFLPAGSSATSACTTSPQTVGVVRLFAKSLGSTSGRLGVELIVPSGVYDAGTFTAAGTWQPSPVLDAGIPGYSASAAFQVRLTPIGPGAAFVVDDVYVDPYSGR